MIISVLRSFCWICPLHLTLLITDYLLDRLCNRFGFRGQVLKWFESYLHNRMQFVMIDGVKSDLKDLQFGVPQGSVLGPILYSLYICPLGDIVRHHGLEFHLYADDTQLYLAFRPFTAEQHSSLARIEACVSHVDSWLVRNKLKLNKGKTKLLILNASHRPCPLIEVIQVSSEQIMPVSSARNLGVIFDQEITLVEHVTTICKTCFLHLRNIAKIRYSLSQKDTEILVHAFISSKLDSCNSLLYGLPQTLIDRLQAVQNCAAHLVTRSRKHDHITPILKQLHWLPVYSRIKYKILLLTFKALHG